MNLYLAGPDVFAPEALERTEADRRLCRDYGFEPLSPLDNDSTDPQEIYAANIAMIKRAQVVVANLESFRGAEPDSGTVFEVGYAVALGKKVIGYCSPLQTTLDRVALHERRRIAGPDPRDQNGWAIENFGLPANLMLACAMPIVEGDLEDALKYLRRPRTAKEAA